MKQNNQHTLAAFLPSLLIGLSGCGAPSPSETDGQNAMADESDDEVSDAEQPNSAPQSAEGIANADEPSVPDVDAPAVPATETSESTPFDALRLTTCDGDEAEADEITVVDSDIVGNQTWSGTVHVRGVIEATEGAVLNIEPGTQIVMAAESALDFDAAADAVLDAEGTEGEPIRFCGEDPEAGSWSGLELGGTTESVSRLEHVTIAHAGVEDGYALTLNGAALLDNVVVSESGGGGVYAVDFDSDSANLSVRESSGVAVVLASDAALAHFPEGGQLELNASDGVHLRFGEMSLDATLHALGVPYVQEQDLRVKNGAVLTLEAGVEYQVGPAAQLAFGAEGEHATALFLGTEDNPIQVSGTVPASGSWQGIIVSEDASVESVFTHVELKHAGNDDQAALTVNAKITLDRVLVTESDTGVRIGPEGLSTESEALTVTKVGGSPLIVDANALVSLPRCDLSNNDDARVVVEAGAISDSGVVLNLQVPYAVQGDIETTGSSRLTIEPGVEFHMANDVAFTVGADDGEATLVAVGAGEAMIRFRGQTEEPGSWQGLIIGPNVTADSRLDHVEIQHAGGALPLGAALTLQTEISVSHSSFVDSEGSGILKLTSDEGDYLSTNTFSNVEIEVATSTLGDLP